MTEIKNIPVHVSIIMDGNGRWAAERGKERVAGHFEGVESVRASVKASVEAGVKYLSLFAFSEENWNRPEAEVMTLMELMLRSMENEIDTFVEQGIRFVVLGNRARLSEKLNAMIDNSMRRTENGRTLTVIVFLSYSGKWDILQAATRLAKQCAQDPSKLESITPETFSSLLVTANFPDPDLIIRTSGESRLSNYLLWQGAYSEFYFTPVLWPDFRRDEYFKALESYSKRDRRYGKVK